jgi:hypothetical protein
LLPYAATTDTVEGIGEIDGKQAVWVLEVEESLGFGKGPVVRMLAGGNDFLEQADGVGNEFASTFDAYPHLIGRQFNTKFLRHGSGHDASKPSWEAVRHGNGSRLSVWLDEEYKPAQCPRCGISSVPAKDQVVNIGEGRGDGDVFPGHLGHEIKCPTRHPSCGKLRKICEFAHYLFCFQSKPHRQGSHGGGPEHKVVAVRGWMQLDESFLHRWSRSP